MVVTDMTATDAREELDKFNANSVNTHSHSNRGPVLTLEGIPPTQTSVHQRSHGLFRQYQWTALHTEMSPKQLGIPWHFSNDTH